MDFSEDCGIRYEYFFGCDAHEWPIFCVQVMAIVGLALLDCSGESCWYCCD